MRNRGPPAGTGDATKELKEAHEKETTEKIKCMKQGPAKNMTIAVLKQLGLKDKGIAFSSKAKKSKLVQIFSTQAGYVLLMTNVSLSRSSFTLLINTHKTKSIPK